MEGLTDKQMAFARALAQGYSATEAYMEASKPKKVKRTSAGVAASKWLKDNRIAAEVERLRDEAARKAEDEAVMSLQCAMVTLTECIHEAREAGRYNEVARLVAELAKLQGWYQPEKVEVSSESFRAEVLRGCDEPMIRRKDIG